MPVTYVINSSTFMLYVNSASGSSTCWAEYGLGSRDRVDRVEILWPDGKVEVRSNLAADKSHY
jgi:ASPIC and UnbV